MHSTKSEAKQNVGKNHQKSIYFPEGLPAFEDLHHFLLMWNEEEAPFLWLQSQNKPNVAFVTIDPFLICPEYLPDIPDDDIAALGVQAEEDVFILSIVNIRNTPQFQITANLLSPVVINWKERVAKQVILNNHQNYSVKYEIQQPS